MPLSKLGLAALLAAASLAMACSVSVHVGKLQITPPAPTPQGVQSGRYENAALGFSFDVPDGWAQVTVPVTTSQSLGSSPVAQTVFGQLDPSTAELNGILVSAYRLREAVRENELGAALDAVNGFMAQLAGQAGGQIVQTENTLLAGRSARRYTISFAYHGEIDSTSVFTVMIRSDIEYVLNCQAATAELPAVQRAANRPRAPSGSNRQASPAVSALVSRMRGRVCLPPFAIR